jgi:thiamine-monophosphate kinase
MKEFELIDHLRPLLPTNPQVVTGAGDDCAVLDLNVPGMYTLFKTDAVVEGIHFTSEIEPERVGHKALARCLSDIAAMGGIPQAALVTIALSTDCPVAWVEGVYRGLTQLANRHGIAVVGGETTTCPERRLLSISVIGQVPKEEVMHRSGSQSGDALFVTGELGGSLAGHHLDFLPRLDEGRWLAQTGWVHAMIDVSDGLAGDLPHLLRSNHSPPLGAEIRTASLPIRAEARNKARTGDLAKPAALAALTDGEDFELLFSVSPTHAVQLLDAWKSQFPDNRLTCIGRVQTTPGLWLRETHGCRPFHAEGYQHLRGS